ncbi:hypothetical protein HYV49_04625 [Candidatus Pacearchaeota archaeon]|nr:hypothetical protein [Candidatus Pacearchaeota archaeon]
MESKAGSVLILIGGILTLIGAGVFLLLFFVVLSFSSLSDKIGRELSPWAIALILFCVFALLLAGGILKIYASKLMLNKKSVVKGGIIAIVLGIILSDMFLSLAGGIVAVVQGSEK